MRVRIRAGEDPPLTYGTRAGARFSVKVPSPEETFSR